MQENSFTDFMKAFKRTLKLSIYKKGKTFRELLGYQNVSDLSYGYQEGV